MSTVHVGSQNSIKVVAVEDAFNAVWPDEDWDVIGFAVESGVAEQPIGYDAVRDGAFNRAYQALHNEPTALYGVGLEGGLIRFGDVWMECGIIAVLMPTGIYGEGIFGLGHTPAIMVPQAFVPRLLSGETIDDIFLMDYDISAIGRSESGGFFAFMTNGGIKRHEAYRDGVIFALARFVHPELYE